MAAPIAGTRKGQTACFSQYFNDRSQTGFSHSFIRVYPDINPIVLLADVQLPFFPVAGLLSTGLRDTQPNQVAHFNAMTLMIDEMYLASIQNVDRVGFYPYIEDGTYDQYLYKLLFGKPENLDTFKKQRDTILNFYSTLTVGLTPMQFFEAVNRWIEFQKGTLNKSYFIPAGRYAFDRTSAFGVAWDAWLTTSPTLESIEVIQLLSI